MSLILFSSLYLNTRAVWVPSTWEIWLWLVFLLSHGGCFFYESSIVSHLVWLQYKCVFPRFLHVCIMHISLNVSTQNCWWPRCMLRVFIPTCEGKLFRVFSCIYIDIYWTDVNYSICSDFWSLDADVEYFMLLIFIQWTHAKAYSI